MKEMSCCPHKGLATSKKAPAKVPAKTPMPKKKKC